MSWHGVSEPGASGRGEAEETSVTHPIIRHPAQARYVLPSFVERTSYGIKEMNPYNKLFEERIIFLGVQIGRASCRERV